MSCLNEADEKGSELRCKILKVVR